MNSVFVGGGSGKPPSFERTIYLREEFLVVKGRDVRFASCERFRAATWNPPPS